MKLSNKNVLIVILVIIALLVFIIPFEQLSGRPSILGAVVSKVYINPLLINSTCSLTLLEDWNLVSITCQPENQSIANVLSPINGNYTSIHTYDTSEDLDNWKSYNPSLPGWVVQDLSQIHIEEGYWIKMTNQSTLIVTGTRPSPHSIALIEGWNLVGLPLKSSGSPGSTFSTISGSYSIVWMYNASSNTYLYYNPVTDSGTFTEVTNEFGYWINMTSSDTLWTI